VAPIRNSNLGIRSAAADCGVSPTVVRDTSDVDDADIEAESVTEKGRVSGGGEHLHHAHLAAAPRMSSPSGGPSWAHDQGSVTDDNRVGIH
jgi:hypothetical protein